MNIIIVRPDGELKREEWTFSLMVSCGQSCIYFDDYSFQSRESCRHKKWIRQAHWTRLFARDNNIDNPPFPHDVEEEMRSRYQQLIMELPIKP